MGSYTSAAPVLAARSLGVPVVLHEANAVPGAAIAFLSRFAGTVCTCFPDMERFFRPGTKVENTGLPLRCSFARGSGGSKIPAGPGVSVLVTGGSQGAKAVNAGVVAAFGEAALAGAVSAEFPVRVVHVAGAKNEDETRAMWSACLARLASSGVPAGALCVEVVGFENDMPRRFAESGFCIGRAGASSCFELALCGLPAALVPLPGVSREHQTRNAEAFASRGAAELLPQSGLCGPGGGAKIAGILKLCRDRSALAAMRDAMLSLARPDAAERVADVLCAAAAATPGR